MRRVLAIVLCVLAPLAPASAAASGEALFEKFLEAVGGRADWAAAKGTMNDSQQNRSGDPPVVRASIWMDFTAPRFRIETRGPDFTTVRVIDGLRSWRLLRDGKIEAVPADLFADDMNWYGAHVYRSIHRLAVRDPLLSVAVGKNGRLEVFEQGKRLIWFRLDARGEPFAFGQRDDEAGTICGPWEFEAGGIKHPFWVSQPDGAWRANIKALEVNPRIDAELLERPRS